MAKMNGPAIGAVAVGAVFVYGGIKGYSVLKAIQNIVQGKAAGTGQNTALLSAGTGSGAGVTSDNAIAAEAQSLIGSAPYKWGGIPGRLGKGGWDCSSFVNWILGVKFGLSIPGGPYNGSTHGPVVGEYLTWSGATTVGHTAASAQPGDLVIWPTHIGIAVGSGQYVSAYDTAKGVWQTDISGGGPTGEPLVAIRRIN